MTLFDPERTFSKTIYLQSAQLTMNAFLLAVMIRVRIFLGKCAVSFGKTMIYKKIVVYSCTILKE
ncbi:hypothetical protein HVE01_03780 [Vreelandella venusta]|nr:hypothetical protein HVE01_03780 [Halomonas venusta]